MKFKFIADHRGISNVGRMCALLNVSRCGFYSRLTLPEIRRSIENRALEDKVRVLHTASHGIYGSPKIRQDLTDDGVRCGKNRVPGLSSCVRIVGLDENQIRRYVRHQLHKNKQAEQVKLWIN